MSLMKRPRTSLLADWPLRDFPQWWSWPDLGELETLADRDAMRIEEFRQDGNFVIKVELPGIDPDKDVEITFGDGALDISAERKERHEETDDKGFYRSEFRYGQFRRRLPLPAGVRRDDVSATYDDGILEIRVPLPDAGDDAATKIPIQRA